MTSYPWGKFVFPFAAYVCLTPLLKHLPDFYPIFYGLILLLVAVVSWFLLRGQCIVRAHRQCGAAVLFGIAGFGLWIFLAELNVEARLASVLPEMLQPSPRQAFNPFESIAPVWGQWLFIVVRMLGLAVLVPVIEEVFWRGFIWRWIAVRDWSNQPMGVYSTISFWGVLGLFVLAHPEWLAAAVWCLLINLLFCWKKRLWDCIVAHSVTNLLLGIYVLQTGNWNLW